jgi:PAS domain S-box-containing protein
VSASRQARTSAQIANPLVQASLLGEAVDAADIAILIADEDGRCIAANQLACTMLGYERDDLLQLAVPDFVPGSDPQACFRAVYTDGGENGVVDAVRSDGTALSVRYWATPTRVARMRLVLALGRPETPPAA